MNRMLYLWFGAMLALTLGLGFAFSEILVEVASEQFVYGSDGCPENEKFTCPTTPTGGLFSLALGAVIAVVSSFPVVRSAL